MKDGLCKAYHGAGHIGAAIVITLSKAKLQLSARETWEITST